MGESRRFSFHLALGDCPVSDVLLWRNWGASAALLISSTILWYLFEHGGYNLLSFISNVMFLLVVILFLWAKSASLLNRPLPPIPDLEISEESLMGAADEMRIWMNHALSIAHDITINGNLKLLVQVAFGLWVISHIGSLFNLITLLYIGIVLCLSVPIVYDKYQDHVEDTIMVAHFVIKMVYKIVDGMVLKNIPSHLNKTKKTQ